MNNSDLAAKEHWRKVYGGPRSTGAGEWVPVSHEDLALEHMLMKVIDGNRPTSVLEIGCGDSTWLPYLSKRLGLEVSGMDYSEEGCVLARRRLAASGVRAPVYCADLFVADPADVGMYDLVYSLGVVEHFSNLEDVLSHMLRFVRPGGVLLAEVPNLRSVHGLLMWLYQPLILAKHVPLSKKRMQNAFLKLSMRDIDSGYLGLFSLGIVSWGHSPRFQALDAPLLPVMKKARVILRVLLGRIRFYRGLSLFSPFLYVAGRKG